MTAQKKRRARYSALSTFLLALFLAAPSRAVVIPDPGPLDDATLKEIRASLQAYDAAIIAGDREKAAAYYSAADDESRKLNAIAVDLDIKIEALHQAVLKKFNADAWKRLAPLVGGILPGYVAIAKITSDPQTAHVTIDPYPDDKRDPDHRWFGQIPMEQGKDHWVFTDVTAGVAAERLEQRRWYRDAAAEIADLTTALLANKFPTPEAFETALQKLIDETPDN